MNVLLTGGVGYIGSHASVALSQKGHKVFLYDNLSNSNIHILDQLTRITEKDMVFVEGDVRDTGRLHEILKECHIDVVIHFAGLKSVGESVENPIDYYANNVQGSISLLQAMHAADVKKLIFSSSATVYGEPQRLPLDEKHPTSAINPYGSCKLYIEGMLKDISKSDASWQIVCLRYFNPAGAHKSGLLGEKPIGVPNNLMPFIVQVASGSQDELNVFGDDYSTPDGTGVRDYIHVMDLADGHAATLDYLSRCGGWDVINLGTGRGYSVFEVIKAFELASGRVIPYKVMPRRSGDVAQCYADVEKAATLLDWTAQRGLNDMCSSAWHFWSKAGEL